MPDDKLQNQPPGLSIQGSAQAEEFLEIAKIHHREANKLFEGAAAAQAEDRQSEAKLLTELAVARRNTAVEFERAARGEGSDPIVAEILDWQEGLNEGYVPYAPTFVTGDEPVPEQLIEELKKPEPGLIARAVAWVGGLISK
ncbi:MAG: hypothetical protein ACLPM3_11545 [Terracidiphilus sp.]